MAQTCLTAANDHQSMKTDYIDTLLDRNISHDTILEELDV
jgi:hypothetical protein